MLKRSILTFLFLIPFIANSQSMDRWQVGLNAAPFYFGRYNEKANREIDKQNIPNGYFLGLTVEKNWNRHWGIHAGLEYSFQNRKDITYVPVGSGSAMNSDFEYLKLPVMLQYSRQLGSNNLFLVINQGVQVSRLINYHTTVDDYLQISTYTSGKTYNFQRNSGELTIRDNEAYNTYVFGVIGSVGFKKYFLENLSYSLNLRYEFDITDADKELFFSWDNHTHNYRFGLVFGIQYHLNKISE